MSALVDDRLVAVPVVDEDPREVTAARRRAERVIGRRLPVSKHEVRVYRAAGMEPPTE